MENTSNIFIMAGGTIRIYDVTGNGGAEQKAFDVKSSLSNINVTGGLLELIPVTGSGLGNATNYLIYTTAPLFDVNINRFSSTSVVGLSTPLVVQQDLNLTNGDFNANSFDLTIGGNLTVAALTTYTPGTNTTTLNGSATQTFTVNLAAPLALNKFTIDKPAGIAVNLAGTQTTLDVNNNFRLVLGTLNDNGNTINVSKDVL